MAIMEKIMDGVQAAAQRTAEILTGRNEYTEQRVAMDALYAAKGTFANRREADQALINQALPFELGDLAARRG